MTIKEMEQTMNLCAVTLQKLNGTAPDYKELYSALGTGYENLINEYMRKAKSKAA